MAQPVTAQPGTVVAPTIHGNRDWSYTMCSCMDDIGTSAYVMFCMPCALCSMSSRLGDCSMMPLCVPGALVTMRTRVRTMAGIRGSICNDCLTVSMCQACAACQLVREMDALGL